LDATVQMPGHGGDRNPGSLRNVSQAGYPSRHLETGLVKRLHSINLGSQNASSSFELEDACKGSDCATNSRKAADVPLP
jgi:hypothetical protein